MPRLPGPLTQASTGLTGDNPDLAEVSFALSRFKLTHYLLSGYGRRAPHLM
jgi:hypothetical protein